MRVIDADTVDRLLSYPALVDTLEAGFRKGAEAPPRLHFDLERGGGLADATLLLMPAWSAPAPATATASDGYACIKLVTVTPDNAARHGRPAVAGAVILFSTDTGEPVAIIDGARLTVWRTAAASALASRYLSRADSATLLMIGAGALAPQLIRAHASVRPITSVLIWNRTLERANDLVAALRDDRTLSCEISLADDRSSALQSADIVSVATLSDEPLVEGDTLQAGQHVDCVGAFKPTMRETDDEAIRRAEVWVDTMAGGLSEAGDIVQAIGSGALVESDIRGDLFGLASGAAPKRSSETAITLFKSVGASIEDLYAAIAVYEAACRESG
ncbi:MAG: ornithine cyclodeaminase family protein [Pseudomonadota bacterium]